MSIKLWLTRGSQWGKPAASKGVKCNRQPSKMQINIDRQKSFKVFQIWLFQMIFKNFWLLKNLLTGKTISHVLKKSFSRHFKTLKLISIGS